MNCELAARRLAAQSILYRISIHHDPRSPHAPSLPRLPDIREAVRDLCSQFPGEYFRKIDEERGYPETFVRALTEAGWLAALIPRNTAAPAWA